LADHDNASDEGTSGVIAAVDLGSNSFHIVVARAQHGRLAILDRMRDMVRLASGLTEHGYLDVDSQRRALACLKRFGQRLRDMEAHRVRVVGTSALRRARNAEPFLAAAEEALGGHPVDVISGVEEARLIYLGVSHHSPSGSGPMLVVDVGGGSTELIIGEGYEPKQLESLSVGCIGLTNQFFADGKLTRRRFERARLEVQLELRPIREPFRRSGWARAMGSSGTVKAAAEVAHQLGVGDGGLSVPAVERIIDEMIDARRLLDLKLPGLSAERATVFPGGVAILAQVMSSLGIERLEPSDGALREGLLYDMLGRLRDEDARERSVSDMQRRFHVDIEQGARVEATVEALLEPVERVWALRDARCRQLLHWAARLHEVGLDIAHSKYHQHGGYLLAHADMPGFGRLEQQLLATLVSSHRRKLDDALLDKLPQAWRSPALQMIVLLRLAVLLNRGRGPLDLPPFGVIAADRVLEMRFPRGWLAANPLTEADLKQERQWLEAAGFELELTDGNEPQEASAS
jgi:exopolyphosphatase / guanosine-5'-triphosphate,3'-diphosphate pyrophosphatase